MTTPFGTQVSVLPLPGGYASACEGHGIIGVWSNPTLAAWDAIGHAATHHTRETR